MSAARLSSPPPHSVNALLKLLNDCGGKESDVENAADLLAHAGPRRASGASATWITPWSWPRPGRK
eukprot:8374406-Lingulodinium_polyedra.AAC.1